jgi:hypothetical protein
MINRDELDLLVSKNVPTYYVQNNFVIKQNGSLEFEDENVIVSLTLNFIERSTFFVPSYLIVVKLKQIELFVEKYVGLLIPGRSESFTYSLNKDKLFAINKQNPEGGITAIANLDDVKKFWREVESDYIRFFVPMQSKLLNLKWVDSVINAEYNNFSTLPSEFILSSCTVLKKLISAKLAANPNYVDIFSHFIKFITEKDPTSNLLGILHDLDSDLGKLN